MTSREPRNIIDGLRYVFNLLPLSSLVDHLLFQIYSTDPVEREKLTSFVSAKLQQAAQACGGIQALEVAYLRDADKDVLKQVLKELGL